MKLSEYYTAQIEGGIKRLQNPNLDRITRWSIENQIKSCEECLGRIQTGEDKDEEI